MWAVNGVGNHIGDVMIIMLASSAVDREFESQLGETKDYKLVFAASQQSMKLLGVRTILHSVCKLLTNTNIFI